MMNGEDRFGNIAIQKKDVPVEMYIDYVETVGEKIMNGWRYGNAYEGRFEIAD